MIVLQPFRRLVLQIADVFAMMQPADRAMVGVALRAFAEFQLAPVLNVDQNRPLAAMTRFAVAVLNLVVIPNFRRFAHFLCPSIVLVRIGLAALLVPQSSLFASVASLFDISRGTRRMSDVHRAAVECGTCCKARLHDAGTRACLRPAPFHV
jgi:hypothetical protein